MVPTSRWPRPSLSCRRRFLVAKGIEYRDAGRLEVPDVAGDYGEAVFQGSGGDHQVNAVVTQRAGKTPHRWAAGTSKTRTLSPYQVRTRANQTVSS